MCFNTCHSPITLGLCLPNIPLFDLHLSPYKPVTQLAFGQSDLLSVFITFPWELWSNHQAGVCVLDLRSHGTAGAKQISVPTSTLYGGSIRL